MNWLLQWILKLTKHQKRNNKKAVSENQPEKSREEVTPESLMHCPLRPLNKLVIYVHYI